MSDWTDRAACLDEAEALFISPLDRNLWVGESREAKAQRIASTIAICEACPVLTECRTEHENVPMPSMIVAGELRRDSDHRRARRPRGTR